MRVAIVENQASTPHGQIGRALAEAGAEPAVYRPWIDGRLPDDIDGHAALVVLGGEQSAVDDAAHPYLPALATLMRQYGEAGRAVLGICLGAQILARGCGGTNHVGAAPEFGWRTVRATDAGRSDPVLAAAGTAFPIFQWHRDTFTLPPGVLHLAENAEVPRQAFRFGRAAYGMQFHFEADRAVVAEWTANFGAAAERMQPGWQGLHPSEAARHGPAADTAGLAIARAWVALI